MRPRDGLTTAAAPALGSGGTQPGGLAGKPAEIAPPGDRPALTLRTCGVMPAKGAMTTTAEVFVQQPLVAAHPAGVAGEDLDRTHPTPRGARTPPRRPAPPPLCHHNVA